jgi:hypothetical protein
MALFEEIQVPVLAETSVTSDNMRALTNKLNQQFIVNYYKALNFESIDSRQIIAGCKWGWYNTDVAVLSDRLG